MCCGVARSETGGQSAGGFDMDACAGQTRLTNTCVPVHKVMQCQFYMVECFACCCSKGSSKGMHQSLKLKLHQNCKIPTKSILVYCCWWRSRSMCMHRCGFLPQTSPFTEKAVAGRKISHVLQVRERLQCQKWLSTCTLPNSGVCFDIVLSESAAILCCE